VNGAPPARRTGQAVRKTNQAARRTKQAIRKTNQVILSTDQAALSTNKVILSTDQAILSTNQVILSTNQAGLPVNQQGIGIYFFSSFFDCEPKVRFDFAVKILPKYYFLTNKYITIYLKLFKTFSFWTT
jgi:hypothetical protein